MTNMEDRIEELSKKDDTVRHFVHEDGSHSFIVYDFDPTYADPRDNDGNLATLVMEHRDYRDLDTPESELAEAHDRWDGRRDRETMVRRYIAIFRPDILHYEERWQVNGASQSDWAYGWGYVTRDAWVEAMGEDYTGDLTPAQAFEQEVRVYGLYFAGEVFGCYHLTQGDPIVIYAEQGAYVEDYEVDEDAVWGFLGYDDLKDITQQFTDSPVIEEIWT